MRGLRLGLSWGRGRGVPLPFARPVITGTGTVGEVLTVSSFGTYDSVQWTRDGVAIVGAAGETYTLVEADEFTTIRCEGTIGADTVASNSIFVFPITFRLLLEDDDGLLLEDGDSLILDGNAA